jgi:hypothetical protein
VNTWEHHMLLVFKGPGTDNQYSNSLWTGWSGVKTTPPPPGGGEGIFCTIQIRSKTHPASCTMGSGSPSWGGKADREWHWAPSSL